MARFIRRTANEPHVYTLKDGTTINICACGLSKNEKGLCDGSHHITKTEESDVEYVYDENNHSEVVSLIDDTDFDSEDESACACGNASCGCHNSDDSTKTGCCGGHNRS
jgi:CDGSH-type Zn-finger protein